MIRRARASHENTPTLFVLVLRITEVGRVEGGGRSRGDGRHTFARDECFGRRWCGEISNSGGFPPGCRNRLASLETSRCTQKKGRGGREGRGGEGEGEREREKKNARDWTSVENRIPIKRIESPRSIVDDATSSDKIKHEMRTIAIACNLVYFTRLDPVVLYVSCTFSCEYKIPVGISFI